MSFPPKWKDLGLNNSQRFPHLPQRHLTHQPPNASTKNLSNVTTILSVSQNPNRPFRSFHKTNHKTQSVFSHRMLPSVLHKIHSHAVYCKHTCLGMQKGQNNILNLWDNGYLGFILNPLKVVDARNKSPCGAAPQCNKTERTRHNSRITAKIQKGGDVIAAEKSWFKKGVPWAQRLLGVDLEREGTQGKHLAACCGRRPHSLPESLGSTMRDGLQRPTIMRCKKEVHRNTVEQIPSFAVAQPNEEQSDLMVDRHFQTERCFTVWSCSCGGHCIAFPTSSMELGPYGEKWNPMDV